MAPAISTRRLGRISCKSLEPLWGGHLHSTVGKNFLQVSGTPWGTPLGNPFGGNPFGVPEATHKNLYNLLGIPSDIINPVRTLRPTIVTQARANPSTSLD